MKNALIKKPKNPMPVLLVIDPTLRSLLRLRFYVRLLPRVDFPVEVLSQTLNQTLNQTLRQ